MKKIKIKCPAKINLTLEVLNKRNDGFHNIKSIMQTISLFDFLYIEVLDKNGETIELTGNSPLIPYDEKNLVYKAAKKFLEKTQIKNKKIRVNIEKNIPVEAGLAGGSTDAAGMFYGLNKLFAEPLNESEIEILCASLGSDLNFCYHGGTALCTGRGEKTQKLPSPKLDVTLIKPKNLGISAKEAYTKFSLLKDKICENNTEKLIESLKNNTFDKTLLYNSLENAVINDYSQLKEIKTNLPGSIMSGSGPTFFILEKQIPSVLDESFLIIQNLHTIDLGVCEDNGFA